MNTTAGLAAIVLVVLATLTIGALAMRWSRTTSDFYVASRSVSPWLNASAIGGEYLSAASFLGVAGLVLVAGADVLWYPIGWTTGYLLLLVVVAAPLRRSGAYTIPDFAGWRLRSVAVRHVSTLLVVAVGWLYLMPQFQGAGLTMQAVTGAPVWTGIAVVAVVVATLVASGGMRSITFVQAFQYWLKLTALLVPLVFLLIAWRGDGAPMPEATAGWALPDADLGAERLYTAYAVLTATCLGTMGLPHVVVRFYTNRDGVAARRTTLIVLGLLGVFYLLPTAYGALGRVYAGDLSDSSQADTVILQLPERMLTTGADALGALILAGAFAAFLSTSSGLTMAIAGVVGQEIDRRRWFGGRLVGVASVRVAAVTCVLPPLALALTADNIPIATSVTFAFALAASTFCPLLVLGIWWPRLTRQGAVAGLVGGGLAAGIAPLVTLGLDPDGWVGLVVAQPAVWTVPLGFGLMIAVSLLTRRASDEDTDRVFAKLHTPERA
ncbi:cation acetate symporter [Aeromicrobium sp. Leaf350]|uniref:sodium/solute symporter n=1 Tax=Aeromicrobium sp. Leaf350 TaxID=2876565 RepID=UPI001E34C210|nr:cation acetate symporter [Aeromicrobium sp. Leaf350]